MKTINFFLPIIKKSFIIILISIIIFPVVQSQTISIYQYRHVDEEQMDEFLQRETTFWSRVAENSMKKGNLKFWGIYQLASGHDMPNSPNILFINTFADINSTDGIWDPSEVFPDRSYDELETFSMSKVTHTYYVRDENYVEAKNAQPQDFKYVLFVYHKSENPEYLVELEGRHWAPFIKSAMDNKNTILTAWGNSTVLSPAGPHMPANAISFNVFPTLQDALIPSWDESISFPRDGLNEIFETETKERTSELYRVIQIITPEEEE